MSATYILTTEDPELAAAWERQLPAPPLTLADGDLLKRELKREGARVWIKDIGAPHSIYTAHADTVVILTGEPRSLPFEDAKRDCDYALSYEESRSELRKLAPMAAELAELRAVRTVERERPRPSELSVPPAPVVLQRRIDELEFFEAAVDHLQDKERVIDDFKRGARSRLRASRLTIFLREGDGFQAVSESWRCAANHRFAGWLHGHSAIVDHETVEAIEDPAIKLAARQKMAEWNARLVVPVELHGAINGWLAFGPRADGRPYSADDREDGMMLGRLFSRLLEQNSFCRAASSALEELRLLQEHGPKFCIIDGTGSSKSQFPMEARQLANQARREGRRVEQEFGTLRVAAGPIGTTGACWVCWDESELTAVSTAEKRENEHYDQLNDFGIMLQHELSNAVTSAATFVEYRRGIGAETAREKQILDAAVNDTDRLKRIPYLFSTLHQMSKEGTSKLVMNELVQKVAREVGGEADVPEMPMILWGHGEALHKALLWLCREVVDTKDAEAVRQAQKQSINIRLRQRGSGDAFICIITIKYPGLRLDQLHFGEAQSVNEFPTVPVFLAREVVRFHRGTIHVGQGIDAPELMISLRSRAYEPPPVRPGQVGKSGEPGADPNLMDRPFIKNVSSG